MWCLCDWSGTALRWIDRQLLVMVLVVSVCAGIGWSRGGLDGLEQGSAEITREVLDCGLEVVVYTQEGLVGDTQVWVRMHQGSMVERDHERGSAMMAARAAGFGIDGVSQEQMLGLLNAGIDELLAGEGIEVNASHVVFPFRVENEDDLYAALRAGRALVEEYVPTDSSLELARRGMLDQIERIETEQIDRAMARVWLPELVGGSAYGRLPLPTSEECERLDADSVRGYIERSWSADQASILVVGDVDAAAVIEQAREVFGGCAGGGAEHERFPEVFEGGLGGRVVSLGDVRAESSRLGLVWFGQTHEPRWDDEGVEQMLVMSLVAESMRHRMSLMLLADLPEVQVVRVDAGDLFGRARYGQIVVDFENRFDGGADEDSNLGDGVDGHWEAVLGAIERERLRLVRDGLSSGEIERARAWLIQQWGYEIDQWEGSTTHELARSLSWMLTMDRPLEDLSHWVDGAREILVGVDQDRVREVIDEIFDGDPAVLVLLSSEQGAEDDEVRRVLDDAASDELPVLAEGWIDDLSGPILDRGGGRTGMKSAYAHDVDEVIDEVSLYPGSGVVTAKLSNGLVVRHREMVERDDPDRVKLVVRVGFDSIEDVSMHGAGDVFVEAMERGLIRSRTEHEMRGILIEHDLELSIERQVWGVLIHVESPSASFGRGVELVHALLTDLRIEGGLIDEIAQEARLGNRVVGVPIDAIEVGIGRAFGIRYTQPDPSVLGDGIDARSVREWIADHVRGDAIEVGIAGAIDRESAIQACAREFGGIDAGRGGEVEADEVGGLIEGEETVRVVDPSGSTGVMIGFGACGVDELEDLRILTVAGMVLDRRLSEAAGRLGGEVEVESGAMTIDLMPGRVVMFSRVVCDVEDIEAWAAVLEEELERLAYGGVEAWEVEEPRELISGALEGYFGETDFWATRLAELGQRGADVDGLWSMRDSYSVIGATDIESVFGRWYKDGKHFRIDLIGGER